MDLPSNHHPLPPLVTIRGLMVSRTSPSGPSLPPLVSIQGLSTAAVHELPRDPHQIDVGQLLQAFNTDSRRSDLEQQRVMAGLQEAQAIYESLQVMSREHNWKMEELDNSTRDALQEFERMRSQLTSTLQQVEQQRGVLQTLLGEVTDLNQLQAELSHLREMNARLMEEARAIRMREEEATRLRFELAASVDKAERLGREALHERDAEIYKLRSWLTASEEKANRAKGEAEILRNHINKLRNNTDTADLKSQLAASEDKAKQLKREVEALLNENGKLHNDNTEMSKLKSQLAASEDKTAQLDAQVETLQNDIAAISKLKSQPAASEVDTEQLKGEAETLRKENANLLGGHEELRKENEKLREDRVDLEKHLQTGRSAALECKRLEAELKEVNMSKGIYLEKWLSLRGPIRAVCRIRPAKDPLKAQEEGIRTQISNDEHGASLEVYRRAKSSLADMAVKSASDNRKAWWLDQIFSSADDNDTIWMEIRPLLESALDGAQVVVILFGRTGTGKSFTSEGIWSRLGECLFTDTEGSGSSNSSNGSCDDVAEDLREGQVRLWSTEVYCGELHDLLVVTTKNKGATHDGKLALSNSSGILDPVRQCRASSVVVSTRDGLNAVLKQVSRARISSQTRANDKSSRSHSFTCVELPAGGSITLVDLAGQERNGVGDSKAELQSINSSLTALTQALGKLMTSLHKAGSRGPRGEAGQQATPKRGEKSMRVTSQEGKATPPKGNNSPPKGDGSPPDKTTPTKGVENVWSSPQLLPRIVGALMLRGSQQGGLELKSKVMFLATLDFSTVESTKASEQTLQDLQRSGLITGE
ncbi:carboxy-terminal kinesin 2 [Diaporthe eres]|nr:carboxy-terminal kinesin 2 [Diaporthe eres]